MSNISFITDQRCEHNWWQRAKQETGLIVEGGAVEASGDESRRLWAPSSDLSYISLAAHRLATVIQHSTQLCLPR